MEKVILAKTTKYDGSFRKAGETIVVSPAEKKDFIKRGIISDGKAPENTDNKEIEAFKVENEALKAELEAFKVENEALKAELEALKVEKTKPEVKEKDANLLGKK